MNALAPDYVTVKTRLSALAQLIELLAANGITSTAALATITGYSRRSIQAARTEIQTEGGAQWAAQVRSILRRGVQPAAQGAQPGAQGAQPAAHGNLSHGENACQPPMTLGGRGALSSQQATEQAAASSVHINTEHINIRAREENPSLAGSPQSLAGSALQSPQTPSPSPKPTLESLTARLAPMLTSGETDEEKLEHAEEHVRNLLHSYDEQIINRALTRLTQRLIDGYKVQSFSRMLEALCGDVERDMAAKKPERPVPWGTIDLGDGRYVSEWA